MSDPFDPDPFDILASVAEHLKKENIPVVEYGEILSLRFGYPACIQVKCLIF